MRLAQEVRVAPWRAPFTATTVRERHRHRYEFNNGYRDRHTQSGFRFSGLSKDDLVEIIELPGHPGSSPRSSILSSRPRRVMATRCSPDSESRRQHRTAQLPEARQAHSPCACPTR
jgi:hypothetical protein